MLAAIHRFVKTMVGLALLGTLVVAGWWAYRAVVAHELALWEKDRLLEVRRRETAQLRDQLVQRDQFIQRLELALKLLKVDRRVAQLRVTGQAPLGDGRVRSQVEFCELDPSGRPVGTARQFAIEGDLLYIDAWVIKFADQAVETADPLRSASICLFQRAFGEFQQPSQGFPLDAPGIAPGVYSNDRGPASAFERGLWSEFWDYANDPEKAQAAGVRAAHGEAPSIKLLAGRRYRIELRAAGGLTIVPDEAPAASTAQTPGAPVL